MNTPHIDKDFLKDPIHFLALGFGTGLSPIMPGTIGTLAAIPIYFVMHYLPITYYLIILAIMILIGFWICNRTANDLQLQDPPAVVWDEIVGYLLTMAAVPFSWQMMVLGFIFFRIFDIWKPWPINLIDNKMHNGFGIVLDDLMAAAYALVLLHFVLIVCPITCL